MSQPKGPKPTSRYAGPNHDGAARSSPYPTSRLSAPISLVDTAQEIQAASTTIAGHASARLEVIAAQIRQLQEEARNVLEKARSDLKLHNAECRFQRVPGTFYHLYERPDGSTYFSMLSPEDHGGSSSNHFLGSYRLELDQTWTKAEDVAEREAKAAELRSVLQTRLLDE